MNIQDESAKKIKEPTSGDSSDINKIGCAIQILGVILLFVLISSNSLLAVICAFAGVIGGGLIIAKHDSALSKRKKEQQEQEYQEISRAKNEVMSVIKPKYDNLCTELYKPSECAFAKLVDDRVDFSFKNVLNGISLDCWIDETNLYLLSNWNYIDELVSRSLSNHNIDCKDITNFLFKQIIPLNNIVFYQKEGEIYRETKISGGGGGGYSVKGAVIGGLLAGDAGAIIGSRKTTESIKSETIHHDDRRVLLYYHEDNVNGKLCNLIFTGNTYDSFISIIPDKDYRVLSVNDEPKPTDNSIMSQIKELSDLKEQGILTELEFSEKKKELLSRI